MSEEFSPTFVTITDEDGNDIELELVDALEHNGQKYMAFFPAETEVNQMKTEIRRGAGRGVRPVHGGAV